MNQVQSNHEDIRWHDKLIPYYFIFFFVFLALAAVKMISVAKEGFSGQVMQNASSVELNETNRQIKHQQRLKLSDNWHSDITGTNVAGNLVILDKDKKPLSISEYKFHYFNTKSDKHDVFIHKKLSPAVDSVNLSTDVKTPGVWKLYIIAKTNLGVYHTKKIINVKP